MWRGHYQGCAPPQQITLLGGHAEKSMQNHAKQFFLVISDKTASFNIISLEKVCDKAYCSTNTCMIHTQIYRMLVPKCISSQFNTLLSRQRSTLNCLDMVPDIHNVALSCQVLHFCQYCFTFSPSRAKLDSQIDDISCS